ncbi:hypothetical protein HQN90_30170 [Paenibacillus alba]|uniref:hypothetical protein n=1 Tax=Paenibacillus alba TaxID=1197127 RepID=UPI00156452A5|nr:hypothetical protein [Paenibacillus alba]NQX70414.1 hypothetical protein [Paenibacillus alba]
MATIDDIKWVGVIAVLIRLIFIKESNGEIVEISGIPANLNGGCAFNTLEGIEDANLIAKEYSWMIDDDHGVN